MSQSEILGFEAPDDHEQCQEHGRFRLAPGSGPRFLKAKGEGHSRKISKNGYEIAWRFIM